MLILGVPVFDTAMVSISRARRGLLPFTSPGKDHTAHRLSNLGLGHRGAVVALYGLAVLFGCTGSSRSVTFRREPPMLLAASVVVLGLIAVALLENVPYERQAPKASRAA